MSLRHRALTEKTTADQARTIQALLHSPFEESPVGPEPPDENPAPSTLVKTLRGNPWFREHEFSSSEGRDFVWVGANPILATPFLARWSRQQSVGELVAATVARISSEGSDFGTGLEVLDPTPFCYGFPRIGVLVRRGRELGIQDIQRPRFIPLATSPDDDEPRRSDMKSPEVFSPEEHFDASMHAESAASTGVTSLAVVDAHSIDSPCWLNPHTCQSEGDERVTMCAPAVAAKIACWLNQHVSLKKAGKAVHLTSSTVWPDQEKDGYLELGINVAACTLDQAVEELRADRPVRIIGTNAWLHAMLAYGVIEHANGEFSFKVVDPWDCHPGTTHQNSISHYLRVLTRPIQ